ncbi:hypothetical protein [Kineosporia sp. NBRC 101731]|uniref:hypothetical protein n=1 Tax=Kineosporia sp. NBRC 101731 TaxID=3032199 RepID=UPI0024A130B0|nr:hypothetical protein [Kineosporia sp. NBRC 101731]GLY26827.1 hypothetical protein Kisp02_01920 [Kineosporia sp. NBRC 101731]
MNPLASPASALILIPLFFTLGYLLTCVFWPFGNCRRCSGSGKRLAWFGGKGFRDCPRCTGTGRRLRTGRLIWNFYRRLHGDAHR